MTALDFRHIKEARRTTNQHAARECQFRQRLPTAFVEGTSTIGDTFAAFVGARGYVRVSLELLEFVKGTEGGIFIVQANDKAEGYKVIILVIDERAAVGVLGQGPADGVPDSTALVFVRGDFPQLFQAQSIRLVGVGTQVVRIDETFR